MPFISFLSALGMVKKVKKKKKKKANHLFAININIIPIFLLPSLYCRTYILVRRKLDREKNKKNNKKQFLVCPNTKKNILISFQTQYFNFMYRTEKLFYVLITHAKLHFFWAEIFITGLEQQHVIMSNIQ